MIRELTPADSAVAESMLGTAAPVTRGWASVGADGSIEGVLLDVEGRRGDVHAEDWWAETAITFAGLYAAAADAWMAAGIATHRFVVSAASPLAAVLVDLGFGHQQAYGSLAVDDLMRRLSANSRSAGLEVRGVSQSDIDELSSLVPLVARHQAMSPVFAPRSAEFFDQLPASIADYLAEPGGMAWLALQDGAACGFALAELDGHSLELALVGVTPTTRRSGAASALVESAVAWGHQRGATMARVDWRTTNSAAAAFWARLGFVPAEYRWCRTIDASEA